MIEVLTGFPENVVACRASGRVTKQDYDNVIIPSVERALSHHPKIRCYYELGSQFQTFDGGALWEDTKVGLEHLTRWERVAVVTDVEWLRFATNAFRFLMPGSVRVFSLDESDAARRWITDGL
ncbi:MAG TPA: STAS/SEC14 domain-containing protein [Candidatus Acidoferrales bacterium]|nr:STAS/SEC14 domain-containing protein [Candidatus Acidoferrales bacterium]